MTVVIDIPPDSPAPSMRIAGMTLLERLIREGFQQGAPEVLVRGHNGELPELPQGLGPVRALDSHQAELPDNTTIIPGDQLLGVTVDGESNRRRAEWKLMQSCRRPYDGIGDRYVVRALSLRLTRFLSRFPVRPNHVTGVAAMLGLLACFLVATGDTSWVVAGGLILAFQLVLDSVDGEMARVRHMGSLIGMWFDAVTDDIVDNLFIACLGIGIGGVWMYIGIGAGLARGFNAVMTYVEVAAIGHPGDVMAFRWWFESDKADATETYADRWTPLNLARSLGRRDLYCLGFATFCAARFPLGALVWGVGIASIYFLLTIAHLTLKRSGHDGGVRQG